MAPKAKVKAATKKAAPRDDDEDDDDLIGVAKKGHNKPPKQKVRTGGVESAKLRSYVERIEKLEEEKHDLGRDIADVKAEAKSNGFDVKTLNSILKLRKMSANDRTEQEYMLDLYKKALGMDTDFEEEEEDEDA